MTEAAQDTATLVAAIRETSNYLHALPSLERGICRHRAAQINEKSAELERLIEPSEMANPALEDTHFYECEYNDVAMQVVAFVHPEDSYGSGQTIDAEIEIHAVFVNGVDISQLTSAEVDASLVEQIKAELGA